MRILRNGTLYVLGFGIPLFFLPNIFADAFGLPKFILLIAGFCVLLLLWAVDVFQTNTLHWRATPFDVPLLALATAYSLSTFIASPNKIATLTSAGGAGTMLLLILFYFLTVQTVRATNEATPSPAITGLVHASLPISLWIGVNVAMELLNFKFQISNFKLPLANLSPLGNLLTQGVFLGIVLVYVGYKTMAGSMRASTETETDGATSSPANLILSVILLLGLFATIYKLAQSSPFPLLPYRFGWSIALDAFKNAPVFGLGPANFISAFTRFKPATINATEYWNVTFGMSSNWYFHVLTTVGALGFTAYLFLAWKVWKARTKVESEKSKNVSRLWLSMLAILALQIFVPFNLPLLFVEFVMLGGLGVALSSPATALRLVTVREGLVSVDTGEERVVESWKELEVEATEQS